MSATACLIIALIEASAELEHALGEAWPAVRDELTDLAVRMDFEANGFAFARRVDELIDHLIDGPPDVQQVVRRAMRVCAAEDVDTRRRGRVDAPANLAAPIAEVVIPVYYGTSREWRNGGEPHESYGSNRGSLSFGVARVSIPRNHRVGKIEGPRWWQFEFHPDAEKHIVLLDVRRLERDTFIQELAESIATADQSDALVFVHGYNVAFNAAARSAAQIAVDLKFPGRTLLYSWPSKAGVLAYMSDEESAHWATPHFYEFLRIVLTEVGARRVHVLAHSMGNRPLVRMLEQFDPGSLGPTAASLRQIIFAAPDVDAGIFRQIAATFAGRAERFTLYASSHDVALWVSKLLHRFPRAGRAGAELVVVDGVDTVDASGVDTSMFGLGHSYYGSRRSILSDVANLLTQGQPPDTRFDLRRAVAGIYWEYRA